jgi:nucleoside-diphosphate-sugar epimerase
MFAGRDLVLLSDGKPTRTFCYVADAVVGYFKVLVRGRAGEAYNIGNETPEISMLTLAQMLAEGGKALFGYDGKVVHNSSGDKEYLTDNPQRRCPIIDKARRDLDFEPEVPIEEGMRRTLAWYRGNQQAQDA